MSPQPHADLVLRDSCGSPRESQPHVGWTETRPRGPCAASARVEREHENDVLWSFILYLTQLHHFWLCFALKLKILNRQQKQQLLGS